MVNFNSIPDTAISVGELTNYIQALLEQDDQLSKLWIIGEVSSTNSHRSGLFFTLQDSDTKAAISCVIWKNQLTEKIVQIPVPGEQLIVLGSIRLYPQRGQYQVTVWQAFPAGEGLRAWRYKELRSRLEAEGLFALERKRPLPDHPKIVAVVTSPTAAAWGDIQKTLYRRYPGLQVLFSPTLVQGEQAPLSIVAAIERVVASQAEVLILSRGGGAVEELACFDDERVVRAVANCSIPVITGIGHQRDESLSDLVADWCAHTPTAAAEQVVPELATLYLQHQQRVVSLSRAVNQHLDTASSQLQSLRHQLRRLRLDQQIETQIQSLSWKRQHLAQLTTQEIQQASLHCQMLRQKLATLDPQAVLKRGYAVVRQNGAIARSVAGLELGQELSIQLSQGQIKVKITKIQSND